MDQNDRTLKKSAIVIDNWKLPIFQRHLEQSGYSYKSDSGITPNTLTLFVFTTNLDALSTVLGAANKEAKKTGVPT